MPDTPRRKITHYLGRAWSTGVGTLSILLAVGFALLGFFIGPDDPVLLKYVLLVAIPVGMLILYLVSLCCVLYSDSASAPVRVEHAREGGVLNENAHGVLLVSPSENLSYGVTCGIYYIDETEFEVLIGLASVCNVQENGKQQLEVFQMFPEGVTILEAVMTNSSKHLGRLRVKPGAQYSSAPSLNIPQSAVATDEESARDETLLSELNADGEEQVNGQD